MLVNEYLSRAWIGEVKKEMEMDSYGFLEWDGTAEMTSLSPTTLLILLRASKRNPPVSHTNTYGLKRGSIQ